MGQRISKFAAFVNRTRNVRPAVTRDSSRSRELTEQSPHPRNSLRNLRIKFRVRPLKINLRNDSRPAVPRSRDIDDTGIVLSDEPIQMDIDKILPRRGSPMTKQARLDVLRAKRLRPERS